MSEHVGNTPNSFKEASELPEVQIPPTVVDKEATAERIIDRVIDAAEHDKPIELEYEQSHEAKDTQAYQPMQSVGAILQQKTSNAVPDAQNPIATQQSVDPNAQSDVDYNQALAAFAAYSAPSRSYKWPIIFGALTGLIIAAILILLILT